MSLFHSEAVTVVTKFQRNFLRLVAQSRLEVASMGILECVGQSFLSYVQKIFLPGPGKLWWFAVRFKSCVKRRTESGVLNNTFERVPEIVFLQSLRAQRVN